MKAVKLTCLTNLCFGFRLECPFDTAVQLAAYNLQGKQFSCWLLGVKHNSSSVCSIREFQKIQSDVREEKQHCFCVICIRIQLWLIFTLVLEHYLFFFPFTLYSLSIYNVFKQKLLSPWLFNKCYNWTLS